LRSVGSGTLRLLRRTKRLSVGSGFDLVQHRQGTVFVAKHKEYVASKLVIEPSIDHNRVSNAPHEINVPPVFRYSPSDEQNKPNSEERQSVNTEVILACRIWMGKVLHEFTVHGG
jgi:hypothetical protein